MRNVRTGKVVLKDRKRNGRCGEKFTFGYIRRKRKIVMADMQLRRKRDRRMNILCER